MIDLEERARPAVSPCGLPRLVSAHGVIWIDPPHPALAMDHEPIMQPVGLTYGRTRLNL